MEKDNDILKQFESFKKNEPFKVPENYFDSLLSKIQDKIELQETSTQSALLFKPKRVLALSFMAVGAAVIAFLIISNISPLLNKNSQKTNAEMAEYIESQALSLDDVSLANECISDKEALIEQNDTINYLINNNIESSDIINAL